MDDVNRHWGGNSHANNGDGSGDTDSTHSSSSSVGGRSDRHSGNDGSRRSDQHR